MPECRKRDVRATPQLLLRVRPGKQGASCLTDSAQPMLRLERELAPAGRRKGSRFLTARAVVEGRSLVAAGRPASSCRRKATRSRVDDRTAPGRRVHAGRDRNACARGRGRSGVRKRAEGRARSCRWPGRPVSRRGKCGRPTARATDSASDRLSRSRNDPPGELWRFHYLPVEPRRSRRYEFLRGRFSCRERIFHTVAGASFERLGWFAPSQCRRTCCASSFIVHDSSA